MTDQLDLWRDRPVALPPPDVHGVRLRPWQAAALPGCLAAIDACSRGVVSAVMGSGKSILIAECVRQRPPVNGQVVVVTTPTVRLVDQLADTLARVMPGPVGKHYTGGKWQGESVVVACNPSALGLALEIERSGGRKVALWLADEVHRTQARTMFDAHDALKPVAALGFTATPFRADAKDELSLFTELVYAYSASDAFRDGVVVKPRLISWEGADVTADEATLDLVVEHAEGPGLCNAITIRDAEMFAATLTARGVPARPIHSRLAPAVQAAAIDALKAGDIRCLVHVNMLSEGVDYPWLRWLAMRRPVTSRVRFCQEVGRVLRASPGKDSATLIDPHDLFGAFGLTYEAMLAGSASDPVAAVSEEDGAAGGLIIASGDRSTPALRAQALVAARRYIRTIYLAFLAAGAIDPKVKGSHWRRLSATERQLGVVGNACRGLARDTAVPKPHRDALAIVAQDAGDLTRGDVSDLLSVAFCLRDRRRDRLPWPAVEAQNENVTNDPADLGYPVTKG